MTERTHGNSGGSDGTNAGPGRYGYMFPQLLADPNNLLPAGPDTIAALRKLGEAMAAQCSSAQGEVPAIMTYFGQFIAHDITSASEPDPDLIAQDDFPVLTRAYIADNVRNRRTAHLDLDSLYRGRSIPSGGGRMKLGPIAVSGPVEDYQDRDLGFDLPRESRIEASDFAIAKIGDPRNDENLLLAQLHVAFLRAHNELVRQGSLTGEQAERALRRRYQHAVLHDFLRAVCDPGVVDRVLECGPGGDRQIDTIDELFMPLEFAFAAFRFGHSMIRECYPVNHDVGEVPLPTLFAKTGLSGSLATSDRGEPLGKLPEQWVVDWQRYFGADYIRARRIDTILALDLSRLPGPGGGVLRGVLARVATRDLLRGYRLGLPCGQAVAGALGVSPLTGSALFDAVPLLVGQALEAGGFLERTPLWLYVLAEAGDMRPGAPGGAHLGTVGGTIVAETLWNLIRHSSDSVIVEPPDAQEIPRGAGTLEGIVGLGTSWW